MNCVYKSFIFISLLCINISIHAMDSTLKILPSSTTKLTPGHITVFQDIIIENQFIGNIAPIIKKLPNKDFLFLIKKLRIK